MPPSEIDKSEDYDGQYYRVSDMNFSETGTVCLLKDENGRFLALKGPKIKEGIAIVVYFLVIVII